MRNHGFLWQRRSDWALSACYDLNPVPDGAWILKTSIDCDDATASLRLLEDVAEFYVKLKIADEMIRECVSVTANWRERAQKRQAPQAEVTRMAPAFDLEDFNYEMQF